MARWLWFQACGHGVLEGITGFADVETAEIPPHIGPLGWDHINLTGDYIWSPSTASKNINLRTLRLAPEYLEAA